MKNMFTESTYTNLRGREYREVLMNRDGFTLLAMGFTGKKALEFKLAYIDQFNRMEEHEQLGQVTADKGIDAKLEYYMPLIIFTSLLDIKRTPKESYQKIMSVYADYTVEEITENIEKILTDFLREIMKQNKGAE